MKMVSIAFARRDAIFNGVCSDRIPTYFPKYSLKDVEQDIRKQCKKEGGGVKNC